MNSSRAASLAPRSSVAKSAAPGNTILFSTLMLLRLGMRWFAVDVCAVEEVALKGEVTRVPTAPNHILGVASLRGRLLTVVGLAQMLGGEGALAREGAATLPRLVIVRDGDFEMAIVAESIGGMVEHESVLDAEAERPSCPFATEEFDWQGNRVCLLDVPRLIATAAKLAGILSPAASADREEP